jgi:hypothetical protein
MTDTFRLLLGTILRLFRIQRSFLLENLALRQQVAALKRRRPRPRLVVFDKLFWVLARRFWSGWKQALIVVTPETVVRWHRAGFRLYWKMISKVRRPIGRRQTPKQVRQLIFRMVAENPTWGAPRIHGELPMLGFDISERTIFRWMKRAPRDPERARRWLAFLRNHREANAAMDFFTVPTLRFSVLYCFFVIRHDRRQILHFNVTKHPTSLWIVQQLREACLESSVYGVSSISRDRVRRRRQRKRNCTRSRHWDAFVSMSRLAGEGPGFQEGGYVGCGRPEEMCLSGVQWHRSCEGVIAFYQWRATSYAVEIAGGRSFGEPQRLAIDTTGHKGYASGQSGI